MNLIITELLTGDQVEDGGGGLDADAVVDDAGTTGLLGHGLIHTVIGIQGPQHIGADADTEVAVGDVVAVLHLQGAHIQEGDELALQPLQVSVSKVVGSLIGEAGLILVTGIQTSLQPLVLHAGGDHCDVAGHSRHDVGIGEVLDAVGNISPHLLRQAHLDVGTGGHDELLHAVLEGCVDGVSVLVVRHGGIEEDLLHAGIAAQIAQDRLVEIDLGGHVCHVDTPVRPADIEQAGHGVGLGIEIGNSTLGHGDILLVDGRTLDLSLDVGYTDIAVDPEQGVLALQQRKILGIQLDAVNQGVNLQLGAIDEGGLSVGGQGVHQILLDLTQGSLDGRGDLFDLHGLLIDRAGIEEAVQNGLVGGPHGGGNAGGQGDQAGHQSRFVHAGAGDAAVRGILHQVVLQHLDHVLGILGQHMAQGILVAVVDVGPAGVMLKHKGADLVHHVLDLDGSDGRAANGFIDKGTTLKSLEDVADVAAFVHTAKQCAHFLLLLSDIYLVFAIMLEC